jgi:tetratricopeptide (TPR) repeat protein
MLLGSPGTRQQYNNEEALIIQLFAQSRYAEAYMLLMKEPPNLSSTQYNLALCYYWAGNYTESLICLDKARAALPGSSAPTDIRNNDFFRTAFRQQSKIDDHRQAISQNYFSLFTFLVHDHILRLQTDCWLQLENFFKVIEVATPIANKNYRNITNALQIANNKLGL